HEPDRSDHADGAGDEKCDPAGGLREGAAAAGRYEPARCRHPGGADPAPADSHDDPCHDLRDAAALPGDRRRRRNARPDGKGGCRRPHDLDPAYPAGRAVMYTLMDDLGGWMKRKWKG